MHRYLRINFTTNAIPVFLGFSIGSNTMTKSRQNDTIMDKRQSSVKKLFEYYLQSLTPPVVEMVSEDVYLSWVQTVWLGNFGNKMVGFKDPDPSLVDKKGKLKAPWTIENELSSKAGRLLRTPASIIGRIGNLYKCRAFYASSITEMMQLILVTEQKLYFRDFRILMRYVFGMTDWQLYILLMQLYRDSEICIVSNSDEHGKPIGPFIIQSQYTNPDMIKYHLKCIQDAWDTRDEPISKDALLFDPEIDPDLRNDLHSGNIWFWIDAFIAVDELLARMFASIDDDLDEDAASMPDVRQFNALNQYFDSEENLSIDDCYPYLLELLNIKSRDDVVLTPEHMDTHKLDAFVNAYKQYKKDNAEMIENVISKYKNCTDYIYDFSDPKTFEDPTETATEDDVRDAIELLNANQDSLRKDRKTGKVINAEKIIYILSEIPEIFSLKSLYKVFEAFDTDPEVVRRDVRKLEKDKKIVMARRGLYCSVDYAESHAKKSYFTLESMFSDDTDDVSAADMFDSDNDTDE